MIVEKKFVHNMIVEKSLISFRVSVEVIIAYSIVIVIESF
jgi:hypothetical protein